MENSAVLSLLSSDEFGDKYQDEMVIPHIRRVGGVFENYDKMHRFFVYYGKEYDSFEFGSKKEADSEHYRLIEAIERYYEGKEHAA